MAGLSPVTVTTGAVVSTTFTVLVAEAELPLLSVAEYEIVYEPTVFVSTVPEDVTGVSPWNKSKAVAPASVYEEPNSTVAGLSPAIVITGAHHRYIRHLLEQILLRDQL